MSQELTVSKIAYMPELAIDYDPACMCGRPMSEHGLNSECRCFVEREEPLSLELLEQHKERLGCYIENGAALWQMSIVDYLRWRPNTEPPDVPWTDGGFDIVTEHENHSHSIAIRDPQNLRELETALRIIGVRD